MSAPRFAACKCKHAKVDHDALAPQCSAAGCECLRYRPDVAVAASSARPATPSPVAAAQPPGAAATVTPTSGPTIEQLLAAGKRSQSKRLNALADKISAQIEDLRSKLHAERRAAEEKRKRDAERQEARAEVERLKRQLAAAKEKLKARRHELGLPGGERSATGIHTCPDCPETFDTAQRLGVHRRWHHGYRKAG